MMKKLLQLVVFMMCIAWLLSLFGCGKGHLVDGPGMERGVWSEFTLSRCSESFEPIYSYTVKHDQVSGEAYLCEGHTDGKSVRLEQETVTALFNLDIMSLADAEALDGTFLGLSVTDLNGRVYSKHISGTKEKEILALITPYLDALKADGEEDPSMLDGPDMEYTPPWMEFTISRGDSDARYIFWFTVTDGDPDALVSGECRDEKGKHYEEKTGIPILAETLQALQRMDLEQLPDEEEWPEDMERPMDDSSITLAVTFPDGTVVKKEVSGELSMEIYKLLLPYFINNQS